MKARKFTVMILLSLVVFPLLTSFVSIYGINESPPTTTMEFKAELIHEGAPAIDWELKELVTDTNYTFSSDFAGNRRLVEAD